MARRLTLLIAFASAATLTTPAGSSAAAPADPDRSLASQDLREWPLPQSGFYTPWGIDVADDDTIWFTDYELNQIGRVTPQGTTEEIELPEGVTAPRDIAAAPGGGAWATTYSQHVVHVTPDGAVEARRIPEGTYAVHRAAQVEIGPGGDPWFILGCCRDRDGSLATGLYRLHRDRFDRVLTVPDRDLAIDMALGHDRRMWVAAWDDADRPGHLLRIRADGTYRSYKTPYDPRSITAGPRGQMWFAMRNELRGMARVKTIVGRMMLNGRAETVAQIAESDPVDIAQGSGGSVWVSVSQRPLGDNVAGVVQVTPDGRTRLVRSPFGYGTGWPSTARAVMELARRSDGTVVFSDFYSHVGTIDPDGTFGDIPLERYALTPNDITTGPGGAAWFTETYSDQLGRIDEDGTLTHVQLPSGSHPIGVASGPDGNLWVTLAYANQIARVTPDGDITRFDIPTPWAYPYFIAPGPDGAMWFVEQMRRPRSPLLADAGSAVGRITMDGTITEFKIGKKNHLLSFIEQGPDGAMWFTGQAAYYNWRDCFEEGPEYWDCRVVHKHLGASVIGRIFADGTFETWKVPGAPAGITAGPDGRMWFVNRGDFTPDTYHPGGILGEVVKTSIGYVTMDGSLQTLRLPRGSRPSGPWDITLGDGDILYFTNEWKDRIGALSPAGEVSWTELPLKGASPSGITTAPDGALWLTEPRDVDPGTPVQSFVARLVPPGPGD